MLRKILFVSLLLAIGFVANTGGVSAQAAANYTVEFGAVNLYSNDGHLEYYFSGLDTNTDYIWLLQGIDENGSPLEALETKFFSGGTTATIVWEGDKGAFDRGNGTLYTGPARVIDNFGNTFGPHFLAPGCSQNFLWECGEDFVWNDNGTAVNGPTDRFVVGDRANTELVNVDGYFHNYNEPWIYTTLVGEYTLLHYRCPPGGGGCGTDELRFHSLDDPAVTHRFEIQNFIDYNTDVNTSVLTPWFPYQSYVVLNTAGTILPFINKVQNNNAFNNVSAGDNPHEATFAKGAYDYTHNLAADNWVSDGESVFLVTAEHGGEWTMQTPIVEFQVGSTMFVELESTTEEIWDAGFRDHKLTDSVIGVMDSDDYIFVERRTYNFGITGVPEDGVTLTWQIKPVAANAGVKTLNEQRFDIELIYDVLSALPVGNRVEKVLVQFGLDTPLGRTLAMLFIMGSLMVYAAVQGVRGFIPFALIFIVLGGAWMVLGLGDPLTLILFAVSAVILLFMMVKAPAESGGGM